jgi:predicted nuclease of predicted toxin-antitoxin system
MKKILLDENLPRPLVKHFSPAVDITSVHDLGWAEKKNGELIKAMLENGFEYLMTADKNLQSQQNLEKYPIKLILVRLYNNRYKTLLQHIDLIEISILNMDPEAKLIEIDLRI